MFFVSKGNIDTLTYLYMLATVATQQKNRPVKPNIANFMGSVFGCGIFFDIWAHENIRTTIKRKPKVRHIIVKILVTPDS
jgi:hypothetical protein